MQIIPVCMDYQAAAYDAVIRCAKAAPRNLERRVNVSPCIGSHISQVTGVMLRCARRAMRRSFWIEMLACASGIMRRTVTKFVYMDAVGTVRLEPRQVRIYLCYIASSHESQYAMD